MKDMENKEEKDNLTPDEELFPEDNKKQVVLRTVITLCIFIVLFAGVSMGVISANKKNAGSGGLKESIEKYAGSSTSAPSEKDGTGDDTGDASNTDDSNADASSGRADKTEKTSSPKASPMPEIIPTPEPDKPVMETDTAKDYSKIKFDTKRNLSEMADYFREDNNEALKDLAYLDRYIAMSYSLKDTTDFLYQGDVNENGEPDGEGIAVYADNEYYFGGWKNGVRSGSGKWVHYHIHLKDNKTDLITFHQFNGTFENDLPNGAGQDHYEYDAELLEENTRYITNYICSYKNGLIDGEVYCTTTGKNGEYYDWTGNAKNGAFLYISEARDRQKRGPVMVDRENVDNYLWMSAYENQEIGVKNYISDKKNQ